MEDNRQNPDITKSPFFLMPILLLMWGSFAAVSKLLLNQLDSYQVLFLKYALAIGVFFAVILFRKGLKNILTWKAKEIMLLLFCGILAFLYDILYVNALAVLPAVEASMLNYTFPIFMVIFAVLINREKLDAYKVISLLMGLLGISLLLTKGNPTNLDLTNLIGDLMALMAAICWGLFSNLVKKNTKDSVLSQFLITFVAFVLSTGCLFAFSHFEIPGSKDFYGILWLSMSNIVLGFFLYIRALKYSSASLIASFTFFTPCVTLFFIVLLLGESVTKIEIFASSLILLSVPVQESGPLLHRKIRKSIANFEEYVHRA